MKTLDLTELNEATLLRLECADTKEERLEIMKGHNKALVKSQGETR